MKVINGFFYSQKVTGVQRFARELVNELDVISAPNEYVIVMPQYVEETPD